MYLEHANITVESIEKSMEFLQTAFPDFALRGEGSLMNQSGKWAHVGNDSFYFALQQCDDHLSEISTRYIHDGINHIGMVVEDLDGVTHRLQQRGYDGYETEAHPFRRRAYYFDPNGIEWEFVQYLSDKPKERNLY
ncbi:Lactoylglutathione lyase [Hahella chejuensis KCTC 2396]|uniref:Lactoylglutathione lyase n=1 Tax=Hahella chejuensis (strain KCTC 2396) TaxID=349521 RepID=Q2SLP6_HAHCH|nr:VOC family protein [Hahella chejuensis]ABC28428.1 Lactoylglutathione lyase [Hahella chejuensis KCTC 2396]